MKFRITDRVVIQPMGLTGRVTTLKTVDGEQAYTIDLDDQRATEDGTYCARESELKAQYSDPASYYENQMLM